MAPKTFTVFIINILYTAQREATNDNKERLKFTVKV